MSYTIYNNKNYIWFFHNFYIIIFKIFRVL